MKRNIIILIVCIAVGLGLMYLSLPFFGTYLVADDLYFSIAEISSGTNQLEMVNRGYDDIVASSNLIVLLMGSGPDRVLHAVDLYKAGYDERIIMVRNKERGYELLDGLGIEIPHDTDIKKSVAVQLGAAADDVLILAGDALSTQDEAVVVRDYLGSVMISADGRTVVDNLIIVTSKYHSTRSKKIFTKSMNGIDGDMTVLSSPTPYDDFQAESWWKNREDLKRGVMEYVKLMNFYLREQFEL